MSDSVNVHEPDRAYTGHTLYCESYEDPLQGAGETGTINLIDMEGKRVHTWEVETALQSFCRLRPNGNLLYPTRDRSNIEEAGLRELDSESTVIWNYHCRIDHDYQVLDDGNFLIHTLDDHMVPKLGRGLKRNPYMVEISPEKELIWEWRGEEHVDDLRAELSDEGWAHVQDRIENDFSFDWAHNNTCQVISSNETYEQNGEVASCFEPGNIVFSYLSLDVIGVIDRPSGDIVWAWGPGELDGQHKPHILENGNLLIFDNGTLRGYSRVIEVNPLTEEIEWEYTASPKEDFFSPYISGAQRLPNGNTLVCSGGQSWLFEVAPDGEVVWEFKNPHHDPDSLGNIYRCLRYSSEYVAPLLEDE